MGWNATVPFLQCLPWENVFNEAKWTASLSSGVEGCMCSGHRHTVAVKVALTVEAAAFLLQACSGPLKLSALFHYWSSHSPTCLLAFFLTYGSSHCSPLRELENTDYSASTAKCYMLVPIGQTPVEVHHETFKRYTNSNGVQNLTPAIIFLLSLTSFLSMRDVQSVSLCYCIVPRPWVLIALFYVCAAAKWFVSLFHSVVIWDIKISNHL